jgi:hypothetical protein
MTAGVLRGSSCRQPTVIVFEVAGRRERAQPGDGLLMAP